nr:cytochrome c oxidase subunit 3 [uncultured Carboxylicivirga sp.]
MNKTIELSPKFNQTIHDDKTGMWVMLLTDLLLFAGLLTVYGIYRYFHPVAFHLAAEQLSVTLGTVNTIMLIGSVTTLGMATTAIRRRDKASAMFLLTTSLFLAFMFMANKYFEWEGNIILGLFPGNEYLIKLGEGDGIFYGLYYLITGLHALHILVGFIFITVVTVKVNNNTLSADNTALLDNVSLFWNLLTIIWFFVFTMFYLIS